MDSNGILGGSSCLRRRIVPNTAAFYRRDIFVEIFPASHRKMLQIPKSWPVAFACGTTRFVILTRSHAIKFALFFYPLRPFQLLYRRLRSHGVRQVWKKSQAEHTGGPSLAGKTRFFLKLMTGTGIAANRLEYALYSDQPQLPIAPVLGIFFGGLVLVMERGQPATEQESRLVISLSQRADAAHVFAPCHLFRFGADLKAVDYGAPSDVAVLLEMFSGRRPFENARRALQPGRQTSRPETLPAVGHIAVLQAE